jgi:anti-sigma B factor antagonist
MTQAAFTLAVREPNAPGAAPVVAVTGEIDVLNAADFRAALDATPGPRPLILDLSGLDFLDSAGFAAVEDLLGRAAAVVVLDPSSPVRTAAGLMGLPCHDTVKAARKHTLSTQSP